MQRFRLSQIVGRADKRQRTGTSVLGALLVGKHREINSLAGGFQQVVSGEPVADSFSPPAEERAEAGFSPAEARPQTEKARPTP